MQRNWRTRHVGLTGLCCGAALIVAGLTVAQEPDAQRSARQQRQAQQQAHRQAGEKQFCLSTELIGMPVKAEGEEEAGQIQNLIISSEGQVQYLAVSTEAQGRLDRQPEQPGELPRTGKDRSGARRGRAGAAGGQLVLVPWQLAKFHAGETPGQQYVSVNIEKDRLMSAPSFTQQQLSSAQEQDQIMAQVNEFFNIRQRRGAARPELEGETDQPQRRDRENPRERQEN